MPDRRSTQRRAHAREARHNSPSKASPAAERRLAVEHARADLVKAVNEAAETENPYMRCRAIASVAAHAPDADVLWIANRALDASLAAGDEYWHTCAAAWLVCALVERRKFAELGPIVQNLLTKAEQIAHPVPRMEAISSLFSVTWHAPEATRSVVLDALLCACHNANSWRAGSIMKYIALVIGASNKEYAERIIESMKDSPYKRQARRRLDEGRFETVGPFFV